MFNAKYDKILSVCDSDLLGRKFSEGEKVLDLKKYSSFYGSVVEEKVLIVWIVKAFKERKSMNLVGEKTINLAINVLKIKPKIIKIREIPVLQVYFL